MEGELEMKPRMRLASVAYSLRSQEANNANYAHILSAPDKEPLEAVVVTNDGNVGVGKSTPQAKLDIEGSMKVSGKFDFPNAFGWNWIDTVATKENSVGWVTAVDIQGKTGILLMVQATGGGDYAGNELKISIDGAIWKDYKGNANSVGTNGWLIVDDTEDQNAGILTIVPFKTFQNSLKVELYNFSSTHESNIRLNYLVQ
ncbi:MAG: hypothetical protein E4H13_06605 [Calditrichales bacterium]|nr:MAG: hypothetical protein E4H13_06605 [Calditrichales bacterium]